jgi:hypothetical protein
LDFNPTQALIAVALLICLATASAGKPVDLHISISLTVSEHGRDSNSTKTTFTVSGNRIVNEETYSGYGAGRRVPVHKEYVLTVREMSNLKRLIKEKNLLRSRSLTVPSGNAPDTSYTLTEKISWQGKTSLIEISGSIKSLQSEEMKNNRVYQDADALLEYIRAIINFRQ